MENQKNETSVLEGNALDKFFTDTANEEKDNKQGTEDKPSEEKDLFDKVGEQPPKKEDEVLEDIDTDLLDKKPSNNQTTEYYYDNVVNDFLEEGDWEDMLVETEVEGELVETPLSELKNIDKDTFLELRSHFKELKKQELEEKYISVDGLDETTKKMVELKRKGGDISSLIEAEVKYVNPLKGLDLEDERVQEALVRQKLNSSGQLSESTIQKEIASLKENLELDKRANEVVEEINTNFNSFVEQDAKRQEAELEAKKQQQKEFRKTISETIKGLDIKEEKIVKNILDASTKYDNDGLSNVDRAFFEAKENPQLFAKLAFLLTDEELFDKHMGVKIKNKANLDTVKKVLSLKRNTASKTKQTEKKEKGLDSFFDKQQ